MNKHRIVMDTFSSHDHTVTLKTAFKLGAGITLGVLTVLVVAGTLALAVVAMVGL